jgi:hypothetical protein
LVPVRSDATLDQPFFSAAVPAVRFVQVVPASADVQMFPPVCLSWENPSTATSAIPSASEATLVQEKPDAAVPIVRFIQVAPASVDVQISPPAWTATSRLPDESDATRFQVWLDAIMPVVLFVHVLPESVEVQMSPPTATSWVPAAFAVAASQPVTEPIVPFVACVQVPPEFDEVKIASLLTAIRWVPVPSDATAFQYWLRPVD